MIKKALAIISIAAMSLATPAKAVIMDVGGTLTEVGTLDNLLFSTYMPSTTSFDQEIAQLENFLGLTAGTLDMSETPLIDEDGNLLTTDPLWTQTTTATDSFLTYDFGAGSQSIYYMVEIISAGDHHSHYYFDNQDDLEYAFISLTDMFAYPGNTSYDPTTNLVGDFYFRVKGISSVASVPEPAMLSLLGAGLIGLGLARRRVKK